MSRLRDGGQNVGRRFLFAFAAAMCWFFLAPLARAFPSSRLVYARGAGAAQCPDEGALRKAVAARLGYDPFFATAERTIVVVVAADPVDLKAKVYLVDAEGSIRGLREFMAAPNRCGNLVFAVALSISIAIDPAAAESPAEPQDARRHEGAVSSDMAEKPARSMIDASSSASANVPGRETSVPLRATGSRSDLRWSLGAGAAASIGTGPVPTVGASIVGSARLRSASLRLELKGDLPATDEESRFRFWTIGFNVAPCVHRDPLFACFVAGMGSFAASGVDAGASPEQRGLFVVSGLRGGLELPFADSASFLLYAEAFANLLQVRISSGEREIWRAPPTSASAGGAVMFHF